MQPWLLSRPSEPFSSWTGAQLASSVESIISHLRFLHSVLKVRCFYVPQSNDPPSTAGMYDLDSSCYMLLDHLHHFRLRYGIVFLFNCN